MREEDRPSADERREALVEWLILPESERIPRTKKEFAALYGVSTERLRQDINDPRVQNAIVSRGRQYMRAERTQAVVDALFARAIGAESEAAANSAAKLWLEWTSKADEPNIDIASLSDEELIEIMVRFRQKANLE